MILSGDSLIHIASAPRLVDLNGNKINPPPKNELKD